MKNPVNTVLHKIKPKLLHLKYSRLKRTKWCIKVRILIIKNTLEKFNFLKEKPEYSSSLFPKTLLITGIRKYAINKVDAALIPPELEKKSMVSPNKKLKNIKTVSNFLTG
ncbi:MAG: hypothetical protein ABFR05_04335 [Bacteroidota bacterium]